MNQDVQIDGWSTWRVATAEDTWVSTMEPSDFPAGSAALLPLGWEKAILLRAFGYAASSPEDNTATVRITGYMSAARPGPGRVLWRGQLTAGAVQLAESPDPASDAWDTDTYPAWNEIDTWDATVESGHAASLATAFTGGGQAELLLPVLDYRTLLLEVTDLGDAGELSAIGFLWRPLARSQSLQITVGA